MNEQKQALRQAVEALSGMLEVHGVRHSDLRGSTDIPSSWVELSDRARSAITAATAALAQPEPEPVAWQHKRPVCDTNGILIGYGGWEEGRGLDHWPTRALYASTPAQSAELVAVAAECARLRADLAAMTADRDSWMRQASDRLDDAVKFGTERDQLRAALEELRDRIREHPAYAELTEGEEIEAGGDTAELSYLARVANAALDNARAGESAAQMSALRQPLTRDQVKDLLADAGYDPFQSQERADFINGLRHGERAHGISEAATTP